MNRPYVDFKNKWVWNRIDLDWFPKDWKYQCVDLRKLYMRDVLWIKIWKWGNAKDVWTNKYHIFDKSWQQIKWTKDLMQWDVIVRWIGEYGHIAIVDAIYNWWQSISVLEQNGSGMNSGNWLWPNAIRVHIYPASFWSWVWRCQKIFDNLKKERAFIDAKKCISPQDEKNTQLYRASTRYIAL